MILIFCSEGYFTSVNCMRELLRAVVTKKRILTLLELDAKHGGLTQDTVRVQLNAASAPCSKGDSEYASMYHMWGLTLEVERWGYFMPSAEELWAAMFASEPIEWNRIGFFQVMSHAPVVSASPRLFTFASCAFRVRFRTSPCVSLPTASCP